MLAIETKDLHPSTEACLMALQWLHERVEFARILDMGCGNGILSAVAASIWPEARIIAADISKNAIDDTTRTIAAYGLQERILPLRSDGFAERRIAENGPYDLIIANLVAKTLIKIAPDVKKHLVPGGFCLLAGALSWLADDVKNTYETLGFEFIEEITVSPWQAFILRHANET